MNNEIQNNKLMILGKLAASLVHELRNPLSSLKLNLNYLKMSKDEFEEDVTESIHACLEASDRIQYLVDNTLEFSKRGTKSFSLFSLNDIALQAVDAVRVSSHRKGIVIETNFRSDIPPLSLNKNKVLQVILNLLTNAIDASAKNSEVNIKTYLSDDNFVVLEVEDEGTGIKATDKEKIFSDFYTNKQDGIGLGLSVCKMLLEEHDANIDFKSSEDVGTSFYVKFPIKREEVKQ